MEKIETVGQILDLQSGAAEVTATMREELKQVTDALQGVTPKKVYMEFSPGWTVGSGEYMDEVLTLAGGDNISKEKSGWFEVDPEAVIKANPAVIIYASNDEFDLGILKAIQERPGFDRIDAMKNKQLFPVDDNSISRVGPRLTKVLHDMAKAIHPDKVK
jgi:iron complex transport system substrate-binding protein